MDELVDDFESLVRRDASQIGEEDGAVDFVDGIMLVDVSFHAVVRRDVQQADEQLHVHVGLEDALLDAFVEIGHHVIEVLHALAAYERHHAGIFFQVLEEGRVDMRQQFDGVLVVVQHDFQHVGLRQVELLHVFVLHLLLALDTLQEQRFLVVEDFIECPFGDGKSLGYVVHSHLLDALFVKHVHGHLKDSFF